MNQNFRRLGFVTALLLALLCPLAAQEKPAPAEFDNLWVPGLSAGIFAPFNNAALFTGGSLRFDLLYGLDSKRPDAFAADRGRWEIFLDVGLYGDLSTIRPEHELLYLWMLGFNMSFETPGTLARNFLIPYIGLELGGISTSLRGSGFATMPLLGLNIISLPNCSLSLDGALLLNTLAFSDLLGLMVRANLNFTF